MSFKYILDSSAWCEYLKGSEKGTKIHQLVDNGLTAITLLSVAELADKYERESRSFDKTLQFIKSKAPILSLDLPIVLEAAKIKKKQRLARNKFGLVDALHLSTAKQYNVTFVTTDHDFQGLDNVFVL